MAAIDEKTLANLIVVSWVLGIIVPIVWTGLMFWLLFETITLFMKIGNAARAFEV